MSAAFPSPAKMAAGLRKFSLDALGRIASENGTPAERELLAHGRIAEAIESMSTHIWVTI